MDIQTITVTNIDGSTTEHIILTNDGINFTSMPKSAYLEWQAAQTPNA